MNMNIKGLSQFASGDTKKPRKKINKRHLKYGSLATVLTALFVAAVVLVNVVATMLFDRFPITLDLTGDSIYSVSEETIDYISGIDVPVSITVMSSEEEFRNISDYTVQCAELLENYQQYNPQITVSYKDLLSNPDFTANYSQVLTSGDIIVELGNDSDHERVKVVSLCDIINVPDDYSATLAGYEQTYGALYTHQMFDYYGVIVSSNAEQAITSAIMAVTDANPITVATLTYPGARESDVSGLTDLLDRNGYILTTIDIQTTAQIPDDVDIIIIPAPKVDYTEADTQKITEWLTNGGKLERDLIYVASAEQGDTPNLDALLYRYGITVEDSVIYETNSNYYTGVESYTIQTMVSENYRDDIANPDLPLIVPNSRAITTRFDLESGYTTCEILVSSSNGAVLRSMSDTSEDWDPTDVTDRGVHNSVVLGRYEAINQDTHISSYTNVIAIGSDMMLQSTLMSAAMYNNGDFFLSLINELSGKTEGISILPKTIQASGVLVNDTVKNGLNLTFAVIIPVAVLAIGTVVWIRRRHM